MKLDQVALTPDPATAGADAVAAEQSGYDGWFASEVTHDPFVTLALAADATERIDLGTGIVVAFARNPMDVAYSANDLQILSGGRFALGLGSQIKPHIERRFSAEWSHPAPRMREFILALRAIWAAWNEGAELDFEGEFYRHTLMTPFFSPEPHELGAPTVYLAAVGELMTKVAGEVADGVLCHAFTTERYLREVTLPALHDGAAGADRDPSSLEVNLGVFVVTGSDEQERQAMDQAARGQIAFYGSTPAYRKVLELHGWGELHEELHAMSRRGGWEEMPAAIPDDVLDAFAVTAAPGDVGRAVAERFGDVVDRVSLYTPFEFTADQVEQIRADL
ncbi:MAG: TIGR03617 family F420-dependent LLM class oxidoreductase [Nitriliruptorales bacterium]|nr:TIGR03617 family F420-dependent LLM class oxidoreductase [Nitriliruptorales bacterium]